MSASGGTGSTPAPWPLAPHPSPRPELRSGAAENIGREGIVTVWDADGCYLGCMGIDLWRALVEQGARDE